MAPTLAFHSRRLRPEFVASLQEPLDPDAQPPLPAKSTPAVAHSAALRNKDGGIVGGASAAAEPLPPVYHDQDGCRWRRVVAASYKVRTKLSREVAEKMISHVLRLHADAAVGVLLSLHPWAGLSDVVSQ